MLFRNYFLATTRNMMNSEKTFFKLFKDKTPPLDGALAIKTPVATAAQDPRVLSNILTNPLVYYF